MEMIAFKTNKQKKNGGGVHRVKNFPAYNKGNTCSSHSGLYFEFTLIIMLNLKILSAYKSLEHTAMDEY